MTVLAVLGTTVLATGCASIKINDILAIPENYMNKAVSVSGTITETYRADFMSFDVGAYQIDDGSGKIWVITEKEPPEEGEKVSVKGFVQTTCRIGTRTFGTVIIEKSK